MGSVNVCELLLHLGAEVNVTDENGARRSGGRLTEERWKWWKCC